MSFKKMENEPNVVSKSTPANKAFNLNASEFNPGPTKSSGKLNADAPEFVPGKLSLNFDANTNNYALHENGEKSYNNGRMNYGKYLSQIQSGQPYNMNVWVQPHQQHNQAPVNTGVYHQRNASYDFEPHGFPRSYAPQKGAHPSGTSAFTTPVPPGNYLVPGANPVPGQQHNTPSRTGDVTEFPGKKSLYMAPYNAVASRNLSQRGIKTQNFDINEGCDSLTGSVNAVERGAVTSNTASNKDKNPLNVPSITASPQDDKTILPAMSLQRNTSSTTTSIDVSDNKKTLTWAERTKLSTRQRDKPTPIKEADKDVKPSITSDHHERAKKEAETLRSTAPPDSLDCSECASRSKGNQANSDTNSQKEGDRKKLASAKNLLKDHATKGEDTVAGKTYSNQISYAKVFKKAVENAREPPPVKGEAGHVVVKVTTPVETVEEKKHDRDESSIKSVGEMDVSKDVAISINKPPVCDNSQPPSQSLTPPVELQSPPFVYTIAYLLGIFNLLSGDKLEELRKSDDYPNIIFSSVSVRETRASNNRNEDRMSNNSSKNRNDHWRQSKSFNNDQKSFGTSFKFSNTEFTRDHAEPVHLQMASESSWIMKQAKQKLDKDNQLGRKIMGLLNRLTFEKFDIIYEQLVASGIDTPDHALMLVKFVFGKAVTQHHFIPMYVELCAKLAVDLYDIGYKDRDGPHEDTEPPVKSTDSKSSRKSDFIRILLNCSQESFEDNLQPLTIPEELEGDDRFEYEQKYKHKMRGNMIFVGELFKQKLLAAKLLITCLDQVFSKREECVTLYNDINMGNNHLEAMCMLLQTVGRSFDTNRWKLLAEFEKRIQLLAELGENENICFRIRCLIKNVLDCRQEKWDKPFGRKLEGPCKLQELRSKVNFENNTNKNTQEDPWRNRRRSKTMPEPTVKMDTLVKAVESISLVDLKKNVRSIVAELISSHDPSESTSYVTEMNLPNTRDGELFRLILMDAIELCAKISAVKERTLVTKWLFDLSESRASQHHLISWFVRRNELIYAMEYTPVSSPSKLLFTSSGDVKKRSLGSLKCFVLDSESENSYDNMVEDYPVLPSLLLELMGHMEAGCSSNDDFKCIQRHIKNQVRL